MSQASLPSANAPTKSQHAIHQSMPATASSTNGSTFVNQPKTPTSNDAQSPPLETMQEEESHDEDHKPEVEQEAPSNSDAAASDKPKRRREGTMNKSFKFPPSGEVPAPPPVPDLQKDTQNLPDQDQRSSVDAEAVAQPKKDSEPQDVQEDGMTAVNVVAPSSVEVPPPPPVEKEKAPSGASNHDDIEEVGETEEISLN